MPYWKINRSALLPCWSSWALSVLVGRIFQSVIHPAVGLAADIEKEVAIGNFNNIINGWLIAVQINAAVQQCGYKFLIEKQMKKLL